MKRIPRDGSIAAKMAVLKNDRIRIAWKPKGTSWMGVEVDFGSSEFRQRRFRSQAEAHIFIVSGEKRGKEKGFRPDLLTLGPS